MAETIYSLVDLAILVVVIPLVLVVMPWQFLKRGRVGRVPWPLALGVGVGYFITAVLSLSVYPGSWGWIWDFLIGCVWVRAAGGLYALQKKKKEAG